MASSTRGKIQTVTKLSRSSVVAVLLILHTMLMAQSSSTTKETKFDLVASWVMSMETPRKSCKPSVSATRMVHVPGPKRPDSKTGNASAMKKP